MKTKKGRRMVSSVSVIFELENCTAYIVKDQTAADILERKKMEEKYTRLLYGSFMHELRTPINGIMGIISLLKAENSLPGPIQEKLSLIDKTCGVVQYLIKDISDLLESQYNNLKPNYKEFCFFDTVSNVCNLFENSFKSRGVFFKNYIDSSVPKMIIGDENRYAQILINLIGNALKHTTSGHVKVYIRYEDNYDKLITEVEDTGEGIKEEVIPKLFKLFGNIEDKDNSIFPCGIGLGLAVSKMLCNLLEGDIEVKSEFGNGSTFTFWIKIEKENSVVSPEMSQVCPMEPDRRIDLDIEEFKMPGIGGRIMPESAFQHAPSMYFQEGASSDCSCPKILVVDDNELNKYVIRQYSQKLNINCDSASNGSEAVDLMLNKAKKECCKRYKIVFMDINMPVLDGVQTIKLIKEYIVNGVLKHLPIVAYTAAANEKKLQEFYHLGFSDIAIKPLTIASFNSLLQKYHIID